MPQALPFARTWYSRPGLSLAWVRVELCDLRHSINTRLCGRSHLCPAVPRHPVPTLSPAPICQQSHVTQPLCAVNVLSFSFFLSSQDYFYPRYLGELSCSLSHCHRGLIRGRVPSGKCPSCRDSRASLTPSILPWEGTSRDGTSWPSEFGPFEQARQTSLVHAELCGSGLEAHPHGPSQCCSPPYMVLPSVTIPLYGPSPVPWFISVWSWPHSPLECS